LRNQYKESPSELLVEDHMTEQFVLFYLLMHMADYGVGWGCKWIRSRKSAYMLKDGSQIHITTDPDCIQTVPEPMMDTKTLAVGQEVYMVKGGCYGSTGKVVKVKPDGVEVRTPPWDLK
jgi:hypothetical protein